MTTPPAPQPRKVVVSLLTPVSATDTTFRTITFTKGHDWEYNGNPARLTITDIENDKIAEFAAGTYSGVAFPDAI